jgi:hypothetical protein
VGEPGRVLGVGFGAGMGGIYKFSLVNKGCIAELFVGLEISLTTLRKKCVFCEVNLAFSKKKKFLLIVFLSLHIVNIISLSQMREIFILFMHFFA